MVTEAAVTETAAPETTIPETTVAETTVPTEPALEGDLFLTVSEMNFSIVGEEEDIYVGTAPRDMITWVSSDESIATFQDGILTAVGVGSTTVYAEYGDQRIDVAVSCLAQTEEELNAMSASVRRSPKRIPPVVEEPSYEYFDDVGFVGDSISYILFQYETRHGHLGNPTFLTRGGVSLNGGQGSAFGVLLGAITIAIISKSLSLVGIDAFWQQALKGSIILLAVLVNVIVQRNAARKALEGREI